MKLSTRVLLLLSLSASSAFAESVKTMDKGAYIDFNNERAGYRLTYFCRSGHKTLELKTNQKIGFDRQDAVLTYMTNGNAQQSASGFAKNTSTIMHSKSNGMNDLIAAMTSSSALSIEAKSRRSTGLLSFNTADAGKHISEVNKIGGC